MAAKSFDQIVMKAGAVPFRMSRVAEATRNEVARRKKAASDLASKRATESSAVRRAVTQRRAADAGSREEDARWKAERDAHLKVSGNPAAAGRHASAVLSGEAKTLVRAGGSRSGAAKKAWETIRRLRGGK